MLAALADVPQLTGTGGFSLSQPKFFAAFDALLAHRRARPGVDGDVVGGDLVAQAVIDALRARLAAFKVPARLWWVDAFPVVNSANGTKIQRNKLREMAQARLAAQRPAQTPGPG